jgi:pyridoxine 5'-phosphate synthase PdxJ
MNTISRRNFFKLTATAAALTQIAPSELIQQAKPASVSDVGLYINLNTKDVDSTFKRISDLGFKKAEIYTGKYSMDMAAPLKAAMEKYGTRVLSLFTLGPGPTT